MCGLTGGHNPELFQQKQQMRRSQSRTCALTTCSCSHITNSSSPLSNPKSLKNLGMSPFFFPQVTERAFELDSGSSVTWGLRLSSELITKMNLDTQLSAQQNAHLCLERVLQNKQRWCLNGGDRMHIRMQFGGCELYRTSNSAHQTSGTN